MKCQQSLAVRFSMGCCVRLRLLRLPGLEAIPSIGDYMGLAKQYSTWKARHGQRSFASSRTLIDLEELCAHFEFSHTYGLLYALCDLDERSAAVSSSTECENH